MAERVRLSDALPATRGIPDFLGRPGPTAIHRLNPLTKATLATVTAVAAVVLGGLVGPIVLVALAVVLPAVLAGVLRRLARLSLLLALPIAISAFVVNLFFFPGAEREGWVAFDVPVELGPILVRFQPFAETIRAPEPRYFASGAR